METGLPLRRIRVAHVALGLGTGGMEKLLVEFARHADGRRFELHFIALGAREKLADELEQCGWRVTALYEPPGARPGAVLRLATVLRRWRADLVHTHNTKPLLYAAPAARLAGVPRLLHTRHGQRFGARQRETLLFRLAARLADRVVCVSHDSARLSAEERLAPERIVTVWNGIDMGRFAYAGSAVGGPAVFVGRLSPEKDVATLLRATARVVREEDAFRLEIAGDGPCRDALERLSSDLGLGNHVRFLGEVRDVAALLGRASLFVLPSLTEGVSLTLLEAMARGLPVIATRVGGNPEVVVDGETGTLVAAGAVDELAAAMLRLFRDAETSRGFGRAGRQRVEQHFDVRRMVADYENLYRELAPRRRHESRVYAAVSAPPALVAGV